MQVVRCMQARLAGALAAITRSRSADDGQEALIQVLQGMLGSAAQQQQQSQHHHDEQVSGHQPCANPYGGHAAAL
jgi:hypothetical protein